MLLYIIRHGDPIYDPDSLTEKGHLQAEALAKRLSPRGFDRIFASPMIRAQMTAEPTCRALNMKMQIEDWMSESGAWEDLSFIRPDGSRTWAFHVQNTEYKTEEFLKMGDNWPDAEPFSLAPNARGGYQRIQLASDEFTERLGYKRDGMRYRIIRPNEERIAAFCHQGFGTTWLSHLLAVPPVLFWSSFDITHSSITILHFENNADGWTAPKCIVMGDTSHIYKEGLPMEFNNVIPI
ncbi:MAG: histidine phosphatase family protein [Clostridia bacterium]|nr:histidine phosphatase family protein [Clostridia bacterium]